MTFCIGIKTKHGIVGLSDTRITSGNETTTSKKVYTVNRKNHSFFIMTSGLRSVRDKAITYFGELIEKNDASYDKLYKAVNGFADQVKRVAGEDMASLENSGFTFNLFSIIGGQLEEDKEPKLYLLYPQGNWIEIRTGTPFVIIGNTGFGNPVLRRSLKYDEPLLLALKSAFLAFDATRISANDVDYPIDTVILENDTYNVVENRFEQHELNHLSEFWNDSLKEAIHNLPTEVLEKAFSPKEFEKSE
ncbi:peptidase [Cyclobacterium amurskyense]|jgi:putative proteasome-type protease|uniref:Proteasome-type protease n=1 Tax=Cyclobacterium amurskyense TaxID=320787 RepID=A0A0H4P741_9BACT|nr:peptidase [Cyclobacterium amurskyense]AKP49964.1 Proteasome-type protease [Cyclobacterium amurskyense]|tara:strand:- start:505 stop:1245 length:741 start_codon:yes stop_codon:yes gene_type:complete